MNNLESRNFTIDIARLLGALSVVALHVPYANLPNELVLVIRLWGRWAVPFFFLASGYFFQKNYIKRGEVQFVKTIGNLLAIYIVSNFIYLLVAEVFIQKESISTLLNFRNLDNGISGHLWFIGSMLFGYICLIYLLDRLPNAVLLMASIILYIVLVALDAYSGIMSIKLDHDFVRYFVSIPYLFWGFLVSKSSERIEKISLKLIWFLVLLTFSMQAFEIVLIYSKTGYSPHNQEYVLTTALLALAIFILVLRLKTNKDVLAAQLGRQYSLLIYLYHPLLNLLLFKFIDVENLGNDYLMLLNPILSFGFCLFVFVLINKLYPPGIKILSGS